MAGSAAFVPSCQYFAATVPRHRQARGEVLACDQTRSEPPWARPLASGPNARALTRRGELPAGAERGYSSYIGSYNYDGSRLVTRVDGSSDPSRIGSDQVREVSFEGDDRMILRPPPRPATGGEEYREIAWQRISTE